MRQSLELTKREQDAIAEHLAKKGLPLHMGVTFRDVYFPERYSDIRSRAEIGDFSTDLAGITLNIPFIAANMESVVGAELAVALEREGGLAIPPQTLPLERRLAMLEQIRRADSAFIEKPLCIRLNRSLKDAKQVMREFNVNTLIVVDAKNRPVGVLSGRDWRYESDENAVVKELMGGGRIRTLITAPHGISFARAAEILRKNRVEKLPLIDTKGALAGLITAHGLFYSTYHPRAMRDGKGQFLRIGSIGVGRTFAAKHLREVEAQAEKGIAALLIDTARACSVNTEEAVKQIKKRFKLPLIVGNVSTALGAKHLFEWGADAVKVNQGRGHVCRTSEIGVGTPQITAIAECKAIADLYGGQVIGDGGMKSPGDMVKALIAGADALMTGYQFVRTRESAAPLQFNKDGLPIKIYEGSASFAAQAKRVGTGTLDHLRRPEGVAEEVVVTGTVAEQVEDLLNGFRSAMSYLGVRSLKDLREKGVLKLQTAAGHFEGIKKA